MSEAVRKSKSKPLGSSHSPAFDAVVELLGGDALVQAPLDTAMDTHALLKRGLTGRSVQHLLASLTGTHAADDVARAMGVSVRTFQRIKSAPEKHVSLELSGRAWMFAEVLAKATQVLGSQAEAEAWLDRPAMALEQAKPLELMETLTGTEMVRTLLTRIEYGVYT